MWLLKQWLRELSLFGQSTLSQLEKKSCFQMGRSWSTKLTRNKIKFFISYIHLQSFKIFTPVIVQLWSSYSQLCIYSDESHIVLLFLTSDVHSSTENWAPLNECIEQYIFRSYVFIRLLFAWKGKRSCYYQVSY